MKVSKAEQNRDVPKKTNQCQFFQMHSESSIVSDGSQDEATFSEVNICGFVRHVLTLNGNPL